MQAEMGKAIAISDLKCSCGHVVKCKDYLYLADLGDEVEHLVSMCPECQSSIAIAKKTQHHYIGNIVDIDDNNFEEFYKCSMVMMNLIKKVEE